MGAIVGDGVHGGRATGRQLGSHHSLHPPGSPVGVPMTATSDVHERSGMPSARSMAGQGIAVARWILVVLIVLDGLDSLRAYLELMGGGRQPPLSWPLQELIGRGALVATLWWPVAGFLVSLVALAMAVAIEPRGLELLLLPVAAMMLTARSHWVWVIAVLAADAGFVALLLADPGRDARPGFLLAAATALGFAFGLAGRWQAGAQAAAAARVTALQQANATARDRERRRLSDETSGIVLGRLSSVEAEVAAQLADPGLAHVHAALDRIDASARVALVELRALVGLLREPPPDEADAAPAEARAETMSRWAARPNLAQLRLGVLAGTVIFQAVQGPWLALLTGGVPPPGAVVQGLAVLSLALLVWRWQAGVVATLLTLLAAVATGAPLGWEALLVGIVACVLVALGGRRRVVAVLGLLAVATAARGLVAPDPYLAMGACVALLGGGAALGAVLRHFLEARQQGHAEIRGLEAQAKSIPLEEREQLARELHDLVGHQLSVVTMQIMGHRYSSDPVELREVLQRIDAAVKATRGELELLVGGVVVSPDLVNSPAEATDAVCRTLSEQGFQVESSVVGHLEGLEPIPLRTIARVLQESSTNILRYAQPRSTCHLSVQGDDEAVRVTVRSQLPLDGRHRRSEASGGWGLRGLRERVDLTGGTLRAGADDGQWVVTVRLPRRAAD